MRKFIFIILVILSLVSCKTISVPVPEVNSDIVDSNQEIIVDTSGEIQTIIKEVSTIVETITVDDVISLEQLNGLKDGVSSLTIQSNLLSKLVKKQTSDIKDLTEDFNDKLEKITLKYNDDIFILEKDNIKLEGEVTKLKASLRPWKKFALTELGILILGLGVFVIKLLRKFKIIPI